MPAFEHDEQDTIVLSQDRNEWPKIPIILYRRNDAEKTEETWRYCSWQRWVNVGIPEHHLTERYYIKRIYPDILHGMDGNDEGEFDLCYLLLYPKDGASVLSRLKATLSASYTFRMITRPAISVEIARRIIGSSTWRKRELDRFASGEYIALPWANESWFKDCERIKDHFAHVSKKNPGKIAYTADPYEGINNRKRLISPLAYLMANFTPGYWHDSLSQSYIEAWANKFREMNGCPYSLHFASTEDDIQEVYESGPSSCMSHEARQYATNGYHPTRVYAAGDLQVAYLREGDDIVARTVVWPEKKRYVRIYGIDDSNARDLQQELRALGYAAGSLRGAHLLLEYRNGGIVCPYLDSGGDVGIVGKRLVIGGGDYDASSTNGIIATDRCERCGDGCGAGDLSTVRITRTCTESWCEICIDNYAFYCNLTGDYIHDDGGDYTPVELHGVGTVSRHAMLRRNAEYFYCAGINEWCSNDDYLGDDEDGNGYSIHATPRYALCSASGVVYERDELNEIDDRLIHPDNMTDEDRATQAELEAAGQLRLDVA